MAKDVKAKSFEWIKTNKNKIFEKFCNKDNFPSYGNPSILFMAGCPGAGKTEYSKSLIHELEKNDSVSKYVRIDADEIREMIPQFNGKNSSVVQRAASKGVSLVFDKALKNHQNIVLDGTFANFRISRENVKRALSRVKQVGIFFIYQEPLLSWEFTKAREVIEGRKISKNIFIDAFFESQKNVNLVKQEFENGVNLNLIIQNRDNGIKKTWFNIESIDNYLKIKYNKSQLMKIMG